MRETDFIDQNKDKWTELEELLHEERKDPDKLSNLFIQVTDDLSYSRTFYPHRSVRVYLNNIAQQLFYSIYKNKKESKKHFINFWKEELPQLIYNARKDLLFSFIVFAIAVMIGVVSSANDAHFARVILGNEYVNMTIENIKKGDPMAVYKQSSGVNMFFGITLNNIRVSFMTFVFGAFYVVGTIFMLIYNGIMLGTFQYFFYERGLFISSFLSVWLHGTLEISGIIIAAGAGITMGKGLIFPGTYSRLQSFIISARRGFKILIGIVPIIIMAAIIESFMTRHTEVPDVVKAGIIFLSLLFILGYFVWYPYVKSRKGFAVPVKEIKLPADPTYQIDVQSIKTNGEIFKEIFIFYKRNFGRLLRFFLLLAIVSTVFAYILHFSTDTFDFRYRDWFFIAQFFDYDKIPLFAVFNTILFTINILFLMRLLKSFLNSDLKESRENMRYKVTTFLKLFTIVTLFNCIFFLKAIYAVLIIVVVAPFFVLWMFIGYYEKKNLFTSFSRSYSVVSISPGKTYGLFIMLAVISLIYFFMLDSPLVYFYFDIVNWNMSLDAGTVREVILILLVFISFIALNLVLPMVIIGNSLVYFSLIEMEEANGLKRRIERLATPTKKLSWK